MLKKYNFSYYLTSFLSKYLPGEAGMSSNTISSYRYTFILLLKYLRDEKRCSAEAITIENLNRECIIDFLNWIETSRGCTASSRNVRLAAIRSFFHYIQYEAPEFLDCCQSIMTIPIKKSIQESLNYMSLDGIKLLLSQPDPSSKAGLRDLALLSLMYDTGARVQEIADLSPSCIRFEEPATIRILGKGNKTRIVPVLTAQLDILKQYMNAYNLNSPSASVYPLFQNNQSQKLTRAGISYILNKYVFIARKENSVLIPEKFSCHCLRHSKAMHLLQSGVNLIFIRDILGHCSIQTTEVYARADSKQKREALERVYVDTVSSDIPIWQANNSLLEWLTSLGK